MHEHAVVLPVDAVAALHAVGEGDAGIQVLEARMVELVATHRAGPGARPQVIIAHSDTVIEPNDHVIVFVPSKRMVREVEKLFQVSATFLF